MRNFARALVLGGAILAAASAAQAQTTLLDTIGSTIPNTGVGGTVGYDPNSSNPVLSQATDAGYVVLPFTLSGSGSYTNLTINSVLQSVNPVGKTNAINSVYGAFIAAPTGNSISANAGNVVGGFFQFDTTTANANDETKELITATNVSNVTLTGGTTYWLVISPKNGFAAQPGDTLYQYGLQISNVNTALNGGSNTGTSASGIGYTVSQSLTEQMGANSGDVLSAEQTSGVTKHPVYGEFSIVASSVPETSTVVTALLGLAPIGGLLMRRRRAA